MWGVVINGQNFVDLSGLTADQQAQAGLVCAGVAATHSAGLPGLCAANQLTSSLVNIPAPGTERR